MSCDAPIGVFLSTRFKSGPSARIISHLSGRKVGRGLFGKCKSSSAHGRTSRSASASVTWVIVRMIIATCGYEGGDGGGCADCGGGGCAVDYPAN